MFLILNSYIVFFFCSRLNEKNHADVERKLLKADFHGAYITVTQAKNASLIGVGGITIMETKHTFKVITKNDQVKSKYNLIK